MRLELLELLAGGAGGSTVASGLGVRDPGGTRRAMTCWSSQPATGHGPRQVTRFGGAFAVTV